MIALIFANLILTVTNLFLLRHTNGRLCHIITKIEEALMWQEKRTKDRLARNVEGKNEL
jgi:hypothetical protein